MTASDGTLVATGLFICLEKKADERAPGAPLASNAEAVGMATQVYTRMIRDAVLAYSSSSPYTDEVPELGRKTVANTLRAMGFHLEADGHSSAYISEGNCIQSLTYAWGLVRGDPARRVWANFQVQPNPKWLPPDADVEASEGTVPFRSPQWTEARYSEAVYGASFTLFYAMYDTWVQSAPTSYFLTDSEAMDLLGSMSLDMVTRKYGAVCNAYGLPRMDTSRALGISSGMTSRTFYRYRPQLEELFLRIFVSMGFGFVVEKRGGESVRWFESSVPNLIVLKNCWNIVGHDLALPVWMHLQLPELSEQAPERPCRSVRAGACPLSPPFLRGPLE